MVFLDTAQQGEMYNMFYAATSRKKEEKMSQFSFIKEVKEAVGGVIFGKPKRKKKVYKTAEEICEEELNK